MMLVAKGEVMNFPEAYQTWWANALVKETPRDCVCVLVLRFQGAVFQLRDTNR